MALKYNKLVSGETYKLSYILSDDNRVIIPDLQRDYCWGDKVTSSDISKTYAYAFVEGLINNLANDSLNLGLIYGYEAPAGHIQLCDGQQRFTTLFLLIGMINRKTENNGFQSYLISDFELSDDHEPRLQYAIRESSLYFLSDLTMHFFLGGHNLHVSDIEKQLWFFNDYKLDPSIQSMLKSLEDIETILDTSGLNPVDIGNRIVDNLTFMYYDMENRRTGEETFVIINTTGEPLSTTENLKAMLFSHQSNEQRNECVDRWETWEQFFWKQRDKKKNDTADNGMAEFFRWIMLLRHHELQEETEFEKIQESGSYTLDLSIPVSLLNEYFEIVKWLFDDQNGVFKNNLAWLSPEEGNHEQIVWFRLLPVIAYVKRFPINDYLRQHNDASIEDYKRSVIRIKNLFKSLSKNRNVQRAIKTLLPNALSLIQRMPSDDIISSILIEDGISTMILSEEVKKKLSIYQDSDSNRNKIEDVFWKAEEHNVWNGEIMPMIRWSIDDENIFDFNAFKEYWRIFNALFYGEMDYAELDITRRALIAHGLDNYPRYFRGNTNCSFAYEYSDWHELIFSNVSLFKTFMDQIIGFASKEELIERQNVIINRFPYHKEYAEFVHIPQLLQYCDEKNIQFWWGTWFLMKKQKWSAEHANIKAYKYYLKLKLEAERPGWKLQFWPRNETCVFYDQIADRKPYIAVDMIWNTGEYHDLMEIDLFLKPTDIPEIHEYAKALLKSVADSLSYEWINGRYRLFLDLPKDENESFLMMDKCRHALFNKLSENESLLNFENK